MDTGNNDNQQSQPTSNPASEVQGNQSQEAAKQGEQGQETKQQGKTFTQEEVNEMIADRLKRAEAKFQKEQERKAEDEKAKRSEARKLNQMNDREKAEYQNKKLSNELKDLKAQLNRRDMERVAADILSEKGIPTDSKTLKFVVADTAEETKARIEEFADLVDTRARSNRKQEFNRPTPKANGGGQAVTAKEFKKMGYADRLNLKNTDPDTYKQLVQKTL